MWNYGHQLILPNLDSMFLHFNFVFKAARLGFEPRYTAPEAVVLPLDDLAALPAKLK